VPLDPEQYQRGAVLESDGQQYDVRGAVQAEGGGRFLVIGTLGQPQAGLVSEDVIRDNEDDQYTPLNADDASVARQEKYDERRKDSDARRQQEEDQARAERQARREQRQAEQEAADDAADARRNPTPDPTLATDPGTGGTEGTDAAGPPAGSPADATTTTTPEPGGTPDSTAPAGPGAPADPGTTTTTET
jgi:hypothetical protein